MKIILTKQEPANFFGHYAVVGAITREVIAIFRWRDDAVKFMQNNPGGALEICSVELEL